MVIFSLSFGRHCVAISTPARSARSNFHLCTWVPDRGSLRKQSPSPAHALSCWLESNSSSLFRKPPQMFIWTEEGKTVFIPFLSSLTSSKDWRSFPPGYWVSMTSGSILQFSYFLWNCPRILSLLDMFKLVASDLCGLGMIAGCQRDLYHPASPNNSLLTLS